MKWYWLTATAPRTDLFLLHDYDRKSGEERLLDRFTNVPRCRWCRKWDEEQLLNVGFDIDRVHAVRQDFFGSANDLSPFIVSERVCEVFDCREIQGVRFIPCGMSRRRGRLFLMWPTHRSACLARPADWMRKRPYDPAEDEACPRCGRTVHVVGYPYQSQLTLPEPMTISIPDIRTEMRDGMDHRFFCSASVREIIRSEKLTGASFGDLRFREKWHPPPPEWAM